MALKMIGRETTVAQMPVAQKYELNPNMTDGICFIMHPVASAMRGDN
jgi:hypothetical protein